MKYAFVNNKAYRLENKLKVLLAIIFVSLISVTGYIISRNAYSATSNAYAILYDSGEMVFQIGNTPDSEKGNVVNTYTSFATQLYTSESSVPWYATRSQVTTITFKDVIQSNQTAFWFAGMTNLEKINNLTKLDTSLVTNMNSMFYNCSKLRSINLKNFNTSNVTIMTNMFNGCSNIIWLNLSNFNTSNVANMQNIFNNMTDFVTLQLGTNWHFLTGNGLTGNWKLGSTTYSASDLTSNYNGSTMSGVFNKVLSTEAYAEFDSSTGQLRIFRGASGLYSNGSVVGTKTYYAGIEILGNNQTPTWYGINTSITSVVIEDVFKPKTAHGLFSGCTNLTSITGIDKLDTSNVTNMGYYGSSSVGSGMFENCRSLITIDVSNLNTSNATQMAHMFSDCDSLTSLDVSNFDTSKVTLMNDMFYSCSSLVDLDLSNFNTHNVTTMCNMFNYCSHLVNLNVENFDTVNVTDMSYMFSCLYRVTALDVSSFNTSNVTKMNSMFTDLFAITTIDVSSFDTTNVTNMQSMFSMASNNNNFKLESIVGLDSFNTENVTSMSGMFRNCEHITSLDVSNWDTSNVRFMNGLFNGCINVSVIDVSNWDTSSVTNMESMFDYCYDLISLNLNNFNTNNVTNMAGMFSTCSNLTSLDLSSFNTSNVTTMKSMFSGCYKLAILDISSFNTSNVTNMQYIFSNTNALRELHLGTNWNFLSNTGLSNSWKRDGDTITYTASELINSYNGSTMAGIYRTPSVAFAEYDSATGQLRIFRSYSGAYSHGQTIGTKIYYPGIEGITGATHPLWYSYRSEITSVVIEEEFKPKTLYRAFYECSNLTSITGLDYLDTSNVNNMNCMFYNCGNITSLYLSSFDTSNVTDMSYMFSGTTKLNTLILGTNWNFLSNASLSNSWKKEGTSVEYTAEELIANYNGSTMSGTYRAVPLAYAEFDSSTGYLRIFRDVPGAYTNNQVIGTKTYFTNIEATISWSDKNPSITKVIIEDVYKPRYAATMFYNCKLLTEIIGIENLDTSFVTSFGSGNSATTGTGMFGNCQNLTSLDLSHFNTSNVVTMAHMFEGCHNLVSLDLSGWDTSSATDMNSMFGSCLTLTTVDLSGWDTGSVTDMTDMFSDCRVLNGLNVSHFDTSNVTSMSWMFHNCYALTSLNLSGWNTSNVTTMWTMFYNCSSLTSLNINNWNTGNVTRMDSMFSGCSSLTSLNVSSFNTQNVTTMEQMFKNCSSLTALNVAGFNTTNVIDMSNMFYNCKKVTSLDVSNFNTSNVTSMSNMFYNCATLTSLDVSGFVTNSVTDFSSMFADCKKVISLDISNFNTSNATTLACMFMGCNALTSLDVSSFSTSNVTDMHSMFQSCKNLTQIDVRDFNTSNVINIGGMFRECEKITELVLSNFNMNNVTSMTNMFEKTYALSILRLGRNWKFLTGNALADSWIRDGTSVVYTAEELTNSYVGSSMSGTYRNVNSIDFALLYDSGDLVFQDDNTPDSTRGNVVGTYIGFDYQQYNNSSSVPWYSNRTSINKVVFEKEITPISTAYWFYGSTNLASFENIERLNTENVTTMAYMFYNCSSLTSLDLSHFNLQNVTTVAYMFYGCSSLSSLNLSGWDTTSVTNVSGLFHNCSSLTSLDVSGFNTENVTSMSSMFQGCASLTTLDVSSFDTHNVTGMQHMFDGCSNLTGLDLSGFNTSNVTSMLDMFYRCENLINLNLSGLNMSNVTNMYEMFSGCSKLKNLNLSGVTATSLQDIGYLFQNCSSLEVLDLRGFNFMAVYSYSYALSNLTSLDVLYLGSNIKLFNEMKLTGEWKRDGTSNIYTAEELLSTYNGSTMAGKYIYASPYGILYDNNELVIQRGRAADSTIGNVVKRFKEVRGANGPAWVPWVDYRADITKITFKEEMPLSSWKYLFYGFTSLTEIVGLDKIDVSGATNMEYTFYGCSALTSLDLSNFDTSNVTSMSNALSGMTALNVLKLGENFVFGSNTNLSKQWQRDGDQTIYSAYDLANSYNGSTMAGTYRSIVQLRITEQVRGDLADANKEFVFTITASRDGVGLSGSQAYTGTKSGNLTFVNGVATINLKHDDYVDINFNGGVEYAITQRSDGYTVSKVNDAGILSNSMNAEFIDTLNGTTPTGIFLDIVPYIFMLLFGIGIVVWIRKFKHI